MMKTAPYYIDPIFIVGVGRSGTTMLVNLLGCHPLLSPIYETSFLRNMLLLCEWASWYWGHSLSRSAASVLFGYPRSRFVEKCKKFQQKCIQFREIVGCKPGPEFRTARGKQKYETFPFTGNQLLFPLDALIEESEALSKALQARPLKEEEIYALARSCVDRLFGMHCARANKPFWVNKTPRLLLCLELLPKLYPSAKCIHIVRDGRDVATSFRSLAWGPKDVREAARRWRGRLEKRKYVDRTRLSYMELRYEDLIESPARSLKAMLDFLSIEGDPELMLSQFGVYNHRVGVWRDAFDLENRRAFDREAGNLLIELGYEKDRSWVG